MTIYLKEPVFVITNHHICCKLTFFNGYEVRGFSKFTELEPHTDVEYHKHFAYTQAHEKADVLIDFYEYCFMHGFPYQTQDTHQTEDIKKGDVL